MHVYLPLAGDFSISSWPFVKRNPPVLYVSCTPSVELIRPECVSMSIMTRISIRSSINRGLRRRRDIRR